MDLQYKVKDMTQADFGRLETELAEAEMPGLIACRSAHSRLEGLRIASVNKLQCTGCVLS